MNGPFHDRPLRVALVSSGLGHELRGVETWMADLAMHLPADTDVELWSGGRFSLAGCRRPIRRMWGLGRHHPVIARWSWDRRYRIEQYTAVPGVLWNILRWRPDVVYCGDPVLAWNLKRFRGWHGARAVFLNGMRLGAHWLRGFDGIHLLAPSYLAESDRILSGIPKGHHFAVPHFVDTGRFRPPTPAERVAARKEFGLPQEAFVVLAIGPVGEASGKRLGFLAEEVASGSRSALLVAAGGDEEGSATVRAQAGKALGGRVKMLGRVDRARMPRLHHAADVFGHAALHEPFGIVLLEAMASGVPVIAHDFEVTRWILGATGGVVDMGRPGPAAELLRRWETGPAERAARAGIARGQVVERFSPGPVGAALVREFRRVAGNPVGFLA